MSLEGDKQGKRPTTCKYNLRQNSSSRMDRQAMDKDGSELAWGMESEDRSSRDGRDDVEESVLTGTLTNGDFLGTHKDNGQEALLGAMVQLLKSQQEQATQQASDWRQARKEDITRQKKEREEDVARMRAQMEAELDWKKEREKDREMKERLNQAIRTFPKISTAALLPAQLQNYSRMLDTYGGDDKTKNARLSEVLSGQMAIALQNTEISEDMTFADVRRKLFAVAGLTSSSAARHFMRPDMSALAKMSGVELVNHVRSLVERVMADGNYSEVVVSAWMLAFFHNVGTSQLITAIANGEWYSIDDLSTTVYKCYEIYGSVINTEKNSYRCSQSTDRQKTQYPQYNRYKHTSEKPTCEKCGKVGHKTADCWSGSWRQPQRPTPTCYICQQQGHISSLCPNKNAQAGKEKSDKTKERDKGWKKNNVVSVTKIGQKENEMDILVSGCSVVVVLDSGADISVIPSRLVAEAWYTGEVVELTDFEGLVDRKRRVAMVPIDVGGSKYLERAAVSDHLGEKGLLKLTLVDKQRMSALLSEFDRQHKENKVCMVQTRAMKKQVDEESKVEKVIVDSENAVLIELDMNGKDSSGGDCREVAPVGAAVDVDSTAAGHRPTGQDVTQKEEVTGKESEVVESEEKEEERETPVELDCVKEGHDRAKFAVEVQNDSSLTCCRRLACTKERGYRWENGLLLHCVLDNLMGEVKRIVVPKSRRALLCKLAHDKSGHLGFRKVKQIIQKRFTWPNICADIESYCKSCETCQRSNRRGQARVPMVERPILTEPFEVIAVDLVGPLPMAKNKFQYLLTTMCLATRWPDIVPLRSITAKAVADALIGVFGRTGLPLQILADNGSQFSGKLMKELTSLLGIELKHTTPYHPQCNGAIERMHGTLEGMLKKAHAQGKDWVEQLPFALFALRQMPSRSTGFSPYELVWGKNMRTPLDIVYSGWFDNENKRMNVSEWAEKLVDKLEIMRDSAMEYGVRESEKRKEQYDEGKVGRSLDVGDKIWVRIPGKSSKFSDAWDGPYVVEKAVSRVNYRVKDIVSRKCRTIHINSAKKYFERPLHINGVTVLADDAGLDESRVKLRGEADIGLKAKIDEVLCEYGDLLDGTVGRYNGEAMAIDIRKDVNPVSHTVKNEVFQ